jgi:hypothetical protein
MDMYVYVCSSITLELLERFQPNLVHIWLYLGAKFKSSPGLLPNIYGEALLSASPQAIVTQHLILLNVSLQIAK